MEDDENEVKITVVGDSATGKTCLLSVFNGDNYSKRYNTSVLHQFQKRMIVNGKQYVLHLRDTSGLEEYDRARSWCYSGANVVLICFGLDDRVSLDNIRHKWYPEAAYYAPNIPLILIGTKTDLSELKLTNDDVTDVKKQVNAKRVIMCSAVTGHNVDKVFRESVLVVRKSQGSFLKNFLCKC